MEDFQIIELFWNRNEAAISEISAKYGAYCHKITLNVLSNNEDAEECVNDTWLRVWNSIPPERPKNLRAWLGKIALNLSLNLWHKNHAQKRYSGMEQILSELEDCIPSGQNVEQQIEADEISRIINSWISTLNKRDRVVFVRRYWYGDSVNELALKFTTSPAKMAKRLFLLKAKLRAALEKENIFT